MIEPVPCKCGEHMHPCIEAARDMRVSHWYCPACGRDDRAINRERQIKESDLNTSNEWVKYQ